MKGKSWRSRLVAGSMSVGALVFLSSQANACIDDGEGAFLRTDCYAGVAANSAIVDTSLDALLKLSDDIILANVGPAIAAAPVQSSPFGVFASGQLAHTKHDGFSISNDLGAFDGPGFDVDEFSAAVSVDFNAAKHFGFASEHGLNLGLFGGYASADVNVDGSGIGDATNKSGMFGGYGLYRNGTSYALLAASAFLGNTDVNGNDGSYDTQGYAMAGSIGRIFSLTDRARFDLRGGLLGVTFTGDGYTDGFGTVFGKSRLSFGAVKFDPGIYGDYQLGNGMVFSPYARGELQQRFGYSNTASVFGLKSDFEDADFSVALSSGFNLKMSSATTVSSEIRGKWSEDSSTVSGKLGLKIAF